MIRSARGRRGLTLLELTVVLVILVALAGILVPLLPNMLTRTHTSSSASNNAEINKFVQVYEQTYQSYPMDLDALTDSTGGAVPDYIPNGAGQLAPLTLTAAQANALVNVGLTRLAEMQPNTAALAGQGPTFNPYTGANITVATGTKVITVAEAAVEGLAGLVRDPLGVNGDVYVVFGLGRRTNMIGRVMTDPPMHFSDVAAGDPNLVYARYGLVFRVTRAGLAMDRAEFVGSVAFDFNGIMTTDGHLEVWHKTK